ncbi:MAG: ADP-heptose synthase, partial [Candidatus Riflebacteria bacterium]|nr:ADP-heptose synthase [Candidatus Riflebacteria bacterium]
HARTLGAQVNFFSVTGNDDAAKFAKAGLEKVGVKAHLHIDSGRPTTLKQRFRAANKTMLRVSHLRQHSIDPEIRELILKKMRNLFKKTDLVIFSDFNYGCLPQSLVDQIVEECLTRNIMMVADSQSSSQVGDISRYKNMTLITPTEREARVALHDPESGLAVLAQNLTDKNHAKNTIITLGPEGVFIHSEANTGDKSLTDRLPAMNYAPKDAAGAGDSLLTCASMALALGYDIWKSVYLSSLAAACQVGRIGNIPLEAKDLKSEIKFGA